MTLALDLLRRLALADPAYVPLAAAHRVAHVRCDTCFDLPLCDENCSYRGEPHPFAPPQRQEDDGEES